MASIEEELDAALLAIKILKAENARYREALEKIMVPDPVFYDGQMAWSFKMIAREALKVKE